MPFLNVGYSRPLQNDGPCLSVAPCFRLIFKLDLWDFPTNLQTSSIANELEGNFFRRCPPEKRPSFLQSSNQNPMSPTPTEAAAKDADLEGVRYEEQGKKKQAYDSSLMKALHQTFFYRWWFAGLLKLLSGALQRSR